ncbi:Cysteine protease atg4c [Desmophyllum pertusum]|uniref:Cysteine protease n=1 Tax=Desmophyllum pertusum TaxID=174260 RepID=A0A9X0CSX1_9CNID|nr:Cysteine protease atg4c [Desmophyllum pertusum]
MVCLDPHYCQSAVDMSKDDFPTQSFHSIQPRTMSFKKMDPSCTIGFYCDSKADFERFRQQTTEVLRPPMQRGDYPMFIFASHRKPLASDDLVRCANLSESLLESTGPEPEPEKPQNSLANVSALSCSPSPEEYVVL